ncbi:ECF transporter S component [Actinomycetota bacterium]
MSATSGRGQTAPQPGRGAANAIGLQGRSSLAIALVSLVGLIAFGWPLLGAPDSGVAHSGDAPLVFALVLPLLLAVVLAQISEGGLDVKAIAMLGVLSAVGAALRPLGGGTAGVETVFVLIVLGGRVFGPGFGFVLGSTTLFGSALLTGGVGPWLPFQMIAASWVGLGAGLLPHLRGRAEVAMLAAYGAVASMLYGLALNFSFWPFTVGAGTELSYAAGAPLLDNLHRFLVFAVTTSLGWDLMRAATTAMLVLLAGHAVLGALRRAHRRAAFEAPVVFGAPAPTTADPLDDGSHDPGIATQGREPARP